MNYNRKSKLSKIILLIAAILVLGAVSFWFFIIKQNDSAQNDLQIEDASVNDTNDTTTQISTAEPEPLKSGSFTSPGNYGTVQAKGYATTTQVDESFCDENCKTFKYVMFQIVETPNQDFIKYIESMSDNSFVAKSAIGLGCVEGDIISYHNSSDQFGMKQYSLSSELTTKILTSTPEDQISLELERLQFTGGSGAPSCYSHITNISAL